MATMTERALYVALITLWLAATNIMMPLSPSLLLVLVCFLLALWGLFHIEARLPGARQPTAGYLLRAIVVTLALVTMSLFSNIWSTAGGLFGIVDIGESHSIYATSWNIRDWVTFFLQDHATSPDPEAHPYLYIHHPNFFSRLFTFAGILLGASLEWLRLITLGFSALSLVLIYHAMSRQFAPVVGVAAACFVAVSYGVFYKTAGDLLRAFHPIMFWGTVWLLAVNSGFVSKRGNYFLALLSVIVATGDWAYFIFWVTFVTLWALYKDGDRAFISLMRYVYAPAAASLFLYFLIVIYAVGWDFFLTDLLVTYFGKAGESLASIFSPRDWSYGSFLQYYRAHNVVLWDMATSSVTAKQLFDAYRASMNLGDSLLSCIFILIDIFAISFVVLRVCATWQVKLAAILLPIGAALGMLPDIAYGAAALLVALYLPSLRTFEQASNARTGVVWLNVVLDLTVWLTVVILSLFAMGTIFPNYANWLFRAPMPPTLIAEAGGFGLLCFVLVHCSVALRNSLEVRPGKADYHALLRAKSFVLSWKFLLFFRLASVLMRIIPRPRSLSRTQSRALQPLGAVVIAAIIGAAIVLQITASLDRYNKVPPLSPPYQGFLSQEQFRGKSVLATTYDAVAWYATKGWASTSTSNPPVLDSSQRRFRHMADWNNDPKYSRPDLILCDNTTYFAWSRPSFPGRETLCLTPGKCDCRDVALHFETQGHRPLISNSSFSVIEMHYGNNPSKER